MEVDIICTQKRVCVCMTILGGGGLYVLYVRPSSKKIFSSLNAAAEMELFL